MIAHLKLRFFQKFDKLRSEPACLLCHRHFRNNFWNLELNSIISVQDSNSVPFLVKILCNEFHLRVEEIVEDSAGKSNSKEAEVNRREFCGHDSNGASGAETYYLQCPSLRSNKRRSKLFLLNSFQRFSATERQWK